MIKGDAYNEKIDSLALGTVTYELFTGQCPFKIETCRDLSKIICDDFKVGCGSKAFRHFVEFILVKDL